MRYIESPEIFLSSPGVVSVFLAGGVTEFPDWRQDMVGLLADTDLVLLDPIQKEFPAGDPDAKERQITWDHQFLRTADAILFWFPKETLCPITLYELGAWTVSNKPIFVGVHPEYRLRQNVEILTKLVRPKLEVVCTLPQLAEQVKRRYDARPAER